MQASPRHAAHGEEHARLEQPELALEVRRAGGTLVGPRLPVAWRTALVDRRHEDRRTGNTQLRQCAVEETAGEPLERQTSLVLLRAGCFAHEHERRPRVA